MEAMSTSNTRGSLVIRVRQDGVPCFEAKWRHEGRQTKRRLGPAWVEPQNGSETPPRLRLKHVADGWQKRRGEAPDGWLDESEAVDLMVKAIRVHAEQMALPADHRVMTFGKVADAWLVERAADVADHHLKASTMKDYRSMLVRADDPLSGRGRSDASAKKHDDEGEPRQRRAWIMRAFDTRPITDVSADDVAAFMRKLRGAGLSPATRRKYEVVVSMILDHAVARGYLQANPVTARPKAKSKRARRPAISVYTMEVVEQIAGTAGGETGEIVRVAALTGLRQGELLGLRWADVDFAGQSITVRRTYVAGEGGGEDVPKSGAARTVALSDQAAVVLDRASRRDRFTKRTDLVFGNELGEHLDPSTLRRLYMKARDAVIAKAAKDGDEIDRLPFHSLRHCFGSRCAAAGVPLSTLQAWMGHANVSTTMQYVHHAPQAHDAARLTAAFAGPVEQVAAEVAA